ncbi:MAG: DUF4173 domain-containing protein [Bacteroidetes bacterium]|nr:MAG: DUF4173 domain-containing protein [Bacteroidota bacterium]
MKNKSPLPLVLISASILTFLFYKESLGLNILIAEATFFLWLLFTKQVKLNNSLVSISAGGLILTSIFIVINFSPFTILSNFLALIIFVGVLIYPQTKSFINSGRLSFLHSFNAQFQFLRELSNSGTIGKNIGKYIHKTRILFFPLIIIFLFIVFYRVSNPVFDSLIQGIEIFIAENILVLFKHVNVQLIITFTFFLLMSNYIFLRTASKRIIDEDQNSSDELIRLKKKHRSQFNLSALKSEYKAALFLVFTLNFVLFILNCIDIYWVWFNFEWEGQYLKQFVHEGTHFLILSILISIGIVLYFFRGNINFYKENKLLKSLCYIWIAQNAILAISVGIRNLYYIQHFNLAYRRIGVIIFLLLTLYGLFTVYLKVSKRKSAFYLFRQNALFVYVVLIFSSLFNWDSIIAKYNFAHADKSFLHLNYMVNLSYKTLPILDQPLPELIRIDSVQRTIFPIEEYYLKPERYHELIQKRKSNFKLHWERKGILSWNLAEYRAYQKLFVNSTP